MDHISCLSPGVSIGLPLLAVLVRTEVSSYLLTFLFWVLFFVVVAARHSRTLPAETPLIHCCLKKTQMVVRLN